MIFLFQRLVTFCIGMLFIAAMYLIWRFENHSMFLVLGIILGGLIGLYFIVASIMPYRQTTEDVSDLAMGQGFFIFPFWLVGKLFDKLGDLF